MTTSRLFAGLVLLGLTGTAQSPPHYMMYGVGTQSCGTWTADRALDASRLDISNRALIKQAWVSGFITGGGSYAQQRRTDVQAIQAWVDNYCREHPLEDLADATYTLTRLLETP